MSQQEGGTGSFIRPGREDDKEEKCSQDRLGELLDSITDAFYALDANWRLTYVNHRTEEWWQRPRKEIVGAVLWDLFPDQENTIGWLNLHKAMRERIPLSWEGYSSIIHVWVEASAYPISDGGLVVNFKDITDRKRLEQQQALLSYISCELVGLKAIDETMDRIGERIGQHFGVKWCMFSELSKGEVSVVSNGWNAEGLHSLKGTYHMRDFLTDEQLARNNAGELTIVSNVQTDARVSAETYGALGIISFIIVPISHDGQWRFQLSIIDAKPREWRDDEVALIRELADRIWARLERARAEEALKASTDELKRSNEELQQFAYIASHDLQEPLRMVTSYIGLLNKKYGDELNPQAKQYMSFAVDGSLRMKELIGDLLQYSRIDSRSIVLEEIYMNKMVRAVTEDLYVAIKETEADVIVEPLPIIRGDKTQMKQLMTNLISNAIKFRGETRPRIEVSAVTCGNDFVFTVKDNGIGIDPKYADKLFKMFSRLHTRDEYPGTGIGLAISKKIVERHGGRIWFESEPGKGTTFYFTIPT